MQSITVAEAAQKLPDLPDLIDEFFFVRFSIKAG